MTRRTNLFYCFVKSANQQITNITSSPVSLYWHKNNRSSRAGFNILQYYLMWSTYNHRDSAHTFCNCHTHLPKIESVNLSKGLTVLAIRHADYQTTLTYFLYVLYMIFLFSFLILLEKVIVHSAKLENTKSPQLHLRPLIFTACAGRTHARCRRSRRSVYLLYCVFYLLFGYRVAIKTNQSN